MINANLDRMQSAHFQPRVILAGDEYVGFVWIECGAQKVDDKLLNVIYLKTKTYTFH